MQARHVVALGQLEAEALGVVVDVLDLGQLQRQEALVAAGEGRLSRGAGLAARLAAVVVVSRTAEGSSATEEQKKVAAAAGRRGRGSALRGRRLGRLGRVTTSLLQFDGNG